MTNERLKEILWMVQRLNGNYLCHRLEYLYDNRQIDIVEFTTVNEHMFERRPSQYKSLYWWGETPDTVRLQNVWLQQKHDWLQKLIDEL